ncbi:MAG TPA: alanine racemase [Acidimicrobiales bacterium]|nr:alanine racemase [Acidimicrobiales bacterium]
MSQIQRQLSDCRPVWVEVDLGAVRHNVTTLLARAAPAALCAVVKADGYGHGALAVAEVALEAGATSLAVALVEEGADLREAGVTAPILLLSEAPLEAMPDVVRLQLTPTIYTLAGLEGAAKAVASSGSAAVPLSVHVKVDTGMHRVGADPEEAVHLAMAVADAPELDLEGLWTHFAVADDPDDPFTGLQTARFLSVVSELRGHNIHPRYLHASNSAATIAHPSARHDLVRCGIAVYGVAPSLALDISDLRPAMTLRARVSLVKDVAAGEGLSYGLRHRVTNSTVVATVPIGYADGVPWQLGVTGADVLIGGRRYPLVGSVTMDQILVDCGRDSDIRTGDDVVLLGRQGNDQILAWDWAERASTIAYDVVCGISARVPRRYVRT